MDTQKVKRILHKNLALNYSKQHMDEIKKKLIERLGNFKTR